MSSRCSRVLTARGPAHRLLPAGLQKGGGLALSFSPAAGFAPDSTHVYLAVATDTAAFLYRARLDGSGPASLVHRISGSSFSNSPATRFGNFRFTSDGARLVFVSSTFNYSGPPNFGKLYSVPTNGSAPPLTLSAGNSIGGVTLSAGGTRVAYYHVGSDFDAGTLSSALVDGSSAPISLLPPGLDYRGQFEATADGTRVVYSAYDFDTGTSFGFYSSPIDASQTPTLLMARDVLLSHLNPATPHVAHVTVNGSSRELRHGPLDASAPSTLLATVSLSTLLRDFVFSPDGTRIVYHANVNGSSKFELYSVPVDGSQPPVTVNGPLVAGGNVTWPDITGTPHFAVTPDGLRVVYAADARVNDIFELWSAPITGGGPAQILNNPLSAGLQVFPDFHILSSSKDLLYRGNPALGFLPLWQARTDRLGPFKLRSGPFPAPSTVEPGFVVTRGERLVVYRADHATPGTIELWAAPLQRLRTR